MIFINIVPEYREHRFIEDRKLVDLDALKSTWSKAEYDEACKKVVAVDHKVFIPSFRDRSCALVIDGGMLKRGVPAEESLVKIAKDKHKLNLDELKFEGVTRDLRYSIPPMGGNVNDTISLFYSAKENLRSRLIVNGYLQRFADIVQREWLATQLPSLSFEHGSVIRLVSPANNFTRYNENSSIGVLSKSELIGDEEFQAIHRNTVIATHDAVITYDDGKGEGIVLMERVGKPLQGFTWLPGGRMQRGVETQKSLASKVKKETGLDIEDLEFAGVERAFMPTDPFGQGYGTDTISPIFYARGQGELRTDVEKNHNAPFLIKPASYGRIREGLHPFVQKYTDVAIGRISSGK